MTIRPAVVAGVFYPEAPHELSTAVQGFLQRATLRPFIPKALVAPHAGYVYSGQVAAEAYVLLQGIQHKIKRVVLLGPCHRVAVRGLALPSVEGFATPLGTVPLDQGAIARIQDLPFVGDSDLAHAGEHSLEVHLPFLQTVLGEFSLLPLLVGETSPQQVAKVLERVWGGEETVIVVSSDLSHFLPYDRAREVDNKTARKIVQLRTDLQGDEACGCRPLNGLLHLAKQKHLYCESLLVRNSGDTSFGNKVVNNRAGDKRRVVGYGAFALK